MRKLILLGALVALPLTARAQVVQCQQNDAACRVHHNDAVSIGNKLDAILQQLKTAPVSTGDATGTATGTTTDTTPPVTTPPVTTPPAPTGQVAALTVGPGQAIVEPADAIGNIAPGGVMTVLPGRYVKAFMNGTPNITVKCQVSMKCIVDGQGGFGLGHRMAWGKAMMLTVVNMTIDGFKFVNCGSPQSGSSYSNESAVYVDDSGGVPITVTVSHSSFDNNANGIFAASPAASIIVDSDVFGYAAPNGMNGVVIRTANGPAHDMYLAAASVEVKGSYFYGSAAHNVKTRTPKTNVHDNPVMTEDGGRVVDLSDGGALTFANNGVWSRDDAIFPKRAIQAGLVDGVFGNANLLGVGTENTNAGIPSGTLTGNTFYIGRTNSTFWVNGGGALTSSGNKVNLFGAGGVQTQGNFTGDISGASAPPGAAAHAPAPPLPPSTWFSP